MKKLIALTCLGLAVAVSAPAFAGSQQEKMKGCNVEAKTKALKGDERKAFMKKCLSKDYVLQADTAAAKPAVAAATKPVAAMKPAASAVAAKLPAGVKPAVAATSGVAATAANSAAASGKQQTKMKTCNDEVKTKNLKGDERRKFMSTCLKG